MGLESGRDRHDRWILSTMALPRFPWGPGDVVRLAEDMDEVGFDLVRNGADATSRARRISSTRPQYLEIALQGKIVEECAG